MDFSILMSIYKNTKCLDLNDCIDSIVNQSVTSNDIVIVIDGELTVELSECVELLKNKYDNINFVHLPHNLGLGLALSKGIIECKNNLVARMDTDDICVFDRFEKQLKAFQKNPKLTLVGGQIAEFIEDSSNIVSKRIVPRSHEEIVEYMKSRNPFNHMTVMFKKKEVIDSGSYIDFLYNEDYHLWVRMHLRGCEFLNLSDTLVLARIDSTTFTRRGGYKYFKKQKELYKMMKCNRFIGNFHYSRIICIKFILLVLMPNCIRGLFYKKFLRS